VKTRISISISEDLVKELDKMRGLVKRSNFIEYLVLLGIGELASNE